MFRLGSGAICQLEETLDLDIMQIFDKLQQGKVRLSTVREFVKASAVSEKDMSNERANDVIDDCGVVPLLAAMTDSILTTFNIPKEKEANPPKPVKATKGAGSGSSSERLRPAS